MTRGASGPADTRMMAIVHDALRRDLGRAAAALSAPGVDPPRDAIGEHVVWMMAFLHAHHRGEDAGLWPLVRARDARAGALLDEMEADHARIAPLIEACDAAARRYGDDASTGARATLLDAIQRLTDVLLPHLRREEDELMPLVSVSLTNDEWRAIDQEYFVAPKSLSQLGLEGHWLLDGLDAARRDIVVHQVPPLARFVLLHGFARRYRRRATACWGADDAAAAARRPPYGPSTSLPRTIPRSGRVEALVPAPVDAVWRVVSDVTRVGEWSHECRRVEWLGGATAAAPGVRFRGSNKAGPWRWSRTSEVLVADEPRLFVWRTISTLLFPDSSEWRITLEPVDGGTRIVQEFRVLRVPAVLARFYALAIRSHRARDTGLTDDLRRLGELAAADAGAERAKASPVS